MDARYINCFLNAAKHVMMELEVGECEKGRIMLKDTLQSGHQVNVIIGISKELKGSLVFGMNLETAKKIAEVIMGDPEMVDYEGVIESSVAEFANMVSGHALTNFAEIEVFADLTPPTVVQGEGVRINVSHVKTIMIELISQIGNIEINVGLELK